MTWLTDFPSTNARVAVSLALAVAFVLTVLAADIAGRPVSQPTQSTLTMFLFGMLSADVAAFGIKRFSDRGLAEAKASGPSPVTVEGPSSVRVTPSEGREP